MVDPTVIVLVTAPVLVGNGLQGTVVGAEVKEDVTVGVLVGKEVVGVGVLVGEDVGVGVLVGNVVMARTDCTPILVLKNTTSTSAKIM